MSTPPSPPPVPNTLGNASLALGIASAALVFSIGLCALIGVQQGWIRVAAVPLFVCGASSAFLGLIGAGVGLGGLLGRNRTKAAAIAGLILSLIGMCLFFAILARIQG